MNSQIYFEKTRKKIDISHVILSDGSVNQSDRIIEIKDPLTNKSQISSKRFLIYFLIFIALIVVGYLFLIQTGILKDIIISSEEWLQKKYEKNPFVVFLIFYLTINLLMIFSLGFKMVVFVIAGLTIKNLITTFILLLFSSISGDFFVFLICTFWLRDFFIRKFKDNDFFIILLDESKKEPFTTAFMTRLLLVPNGLKNYILMAIDNDPASYFISGIVFHVIFVLESIILSSQFSKIDEFLNKNQSWSEKSTGEKFWFLFFLCLVFIGILISIYLGIWVKRKIEAKKRSRMEIAARDFELN